MMNPKKPKRKHDAEEGKVRRAETIDFVSEMSSGRLRMCLLDDKKYGLAVRILNTTTKKHKNIEIRYGDEFLNTTYIKLNNERLSENKDYWKDCWMFGVNNPDKIRGYSLWNVRDALDKGAKTWISQSEGNENRRNIKYRTEWAPVEGKMGVILNEPSLIDRLVKLIEYGR